MKKFIHVDMDAFYVSVELLTRPELIQRPVAVGGSSDRRGVISTCNYVARQFGVHSAMSTHLALRKCPDLVLLPSNMGRYREISEQIRDVFHRYTPLVEPLSLDEAYLDVSECQAFSGSATQIAAAIRSEIFALTGLTASAGIAPLKFLAKIASDQNKPNGQFVISPQQVDSFIEQMPLNLIPGVGKVTSQRLAAMQLFTGADVKAAEHNYILKELGRFGDSLWRRCHGIDERPVITQRIRKSVGVERTFSQDISLKAELVDALKGQIVPELMRRIDKAQVNSKISKLVVKVKFADFHQVTRETRNTDVCESTLLHLLDTALSSREVPSIRLLGVAVGLSERQEKQLSLAL